MRNAILDVNDALVSARRFGGLARAGQQVSSLELMALLGCGGLATVASAFINTPWQIPGQSIVQSVLPMAMGFALVPRRMGGCVMGFGALTTIIGFRAAGLGGLGTGAMTSLLLTGPMLDAALWTARGGWRLYARLILAGLATNVLALIVRLLTKVLSADTSGTRRIASWLPEAVWTYPLCGVIAGLISAWAWFHWSSRDKTMSRDSEP